jgi:hypothetical protein
MSLLINYHVENSYLNLTNTISKENLIDLLDNIKKYNIIITNVNIPKEFKYIDIVKEKTNDLIISYYKD